MKIRNGFVSNSSSSSFAIFGAKLSPEQIEQIEAMDTNPNWKDADSVLNKVGLESYPDDYDGGRFVGVSLYNLLELLPEEQRKALFAPIEAKIKEITGEDAKVGFHSGECQC